MHSEPHEETRPYVLGVVHARGGSKRIPLKNIRMLGGVPLLAYIIRAALGMRHLSRLIVSTDHPDITRVALEHGAEVPFTRPPELSEDVPSELVTMHAVEFAESEMVKPVDIVLTLQPTTPFCTSEDLDACVRIVLSGKVDSAFTAKHVRERPEWMFRVVDGVAHPMLNEKISGERGVYQQLETLITPNGAGYVTRRNTLFKEQALITSASGAHLMPELRSIDIDEPIDLIVAEAVLAARHDIS